MLNYFPIDNFLSKEVKMEKNTFKSNLIYNSLNQSSEKRDDISIKSMTNTTGNTPIIGSYPPPPPPQNTTSLLKIKESLSPKGFFCLSFLFFSLSLLSSCACDDGSNPTSPEPIDITTPPRANTLGVSEIQNYSATLSGKLSYLGTNRDGTRLANEYGFIYSTTIIQADDLRLGQKSVTKIAMFNISNTGHYNFSINGLDLDTTYYYRAFALNDGGTNYGQVSNFFTTCYSESFTINTNTDGEQSNLICPYSAHSYSVYLIHTLTYSLSVEAASNISSNVTVYEGISNNPLYIRAGPFSYSLAPLTISFPGISNGHRYMVLPLASGSHRIVISNNSGQKQSYSLNLEQYQTTEPDIRRLLVAPEKMGYYDSTNDPRHFWIHVPANKNLQVELDAYRGSNFTAVVGYYVYHSGATRIIGFAPTFTNTQNINTSNSSPQYSLVFMRNTAGIISSTAQQTNARFILRFVD